MRRPRRAVLVPPFGALAADLGTEIRSDNLVDFKVRVEVFDLLNTFVLFRDGLLDQNLEVVCIIVKLILIIT
jgi:hypothetical protein